MRYSPDAAGHQNYRVRGSKYAMSWFPGAHSPLVECAPHSGVIFFGKIIRASTADGYELLGMHRIRLSIRFPPVRPLGASGLGRISTPCRAACFGAGPECRTTAIDGYRTKRRFDRIRDVREREKADDVDRPTQIRSFLEHQSASQIMTTSTKPDGAVRGAAAITIAAPDPTFDDVLDRFENEIYRLCTQFAPSRSRADELYREFVARACQTFRDLDGTANLRTWIFNIATSAFLRRHGSGADERTLESVRSTSPFGTGRDQGRLDGQDTVREVDALVRRLPPKQRAALILRKYHGFGYDEIGKSLDASEADARAMTHSALRTLVDHLGDRP